MATSLCNSMVKLCTIIIIKITWELKEYVYGRCNNINTISVIIITYYATIVQ